MGRAKFGDLVIEDSLALGTVADCAIQTLDRKRIFCYNIINTKVLPGRLMAGRMALDHVAKVRVLPGQPIGRYRLGVRTGGSQPSNRGSIPRSAIVCRAGLILDT